MSAHEDPAVLIQLSDQVADTVETIAQSLVTVIGGGRRPSTGLIWRPGLVVTAEEALEADDGITVVLPDGRRIEAALAGRDPSTDIAVLRIEDDATPALMLNEAQAPRAGHFAVTVGRREGLPVAALGIVAAAGGAWRSLRGGHIDRLIRLDLRMDSRSEGGAVVDGRGRVLGMAVFGPRRTVLTIPGETIERVAQQLAEKGRIARGYLGLGLQPLRLDEKLVNALSLPEPRAAMVVSIDPDGPGARAGVLQGDVVVRWNGKPLRSVRATLAQLGPESVGTTVELTIVRGGQLTAADITIAERPAS